MLTFVSKQRHINLAWRRQTGFKFAAATTWVPVASDELGELSCSYPLAFRMDGDSAALVALLALGHSSNVFAAPDGRWLARYVPAALRSYPFRLGTANNGELALVVDESEGVVGEGGEGLVPFYAPDGSPSPDTQLAANFLLHTHRGVEAVQQGVNALAALELLEPWPLKVRVGGAEKHLSGIGRIAKEKLDTIDGEQLGLLHKSGALRVAYAQIFSMGNTEAVERLAELQARYQAAQAERLAIPAGSFVQDDDGDMKIDWDALLKDR